MRWFRKGKLKTFRVLYKLPHDKFFKVNTTFIEGENMPDAVSNFERWYPEAKIKRVEEIK